MHAASGQGQAPLAVLRACPSGLPQESTGFLERLGVCVSLSIQPRFPSLAFNAQGLISFSLPP